MEHRERDALARQLEEALMRYSVARLAVLATLLTVAFLMGGCDGSVGLGSYFSSRISERFHRSSGGAFTLELREHLVVAHRLFVPALGHDREIVEILQELVELLDLEDDGLLGSILVGDVLEMQRSGFCHGVDPLSAVTLAP
jgi:hypothetical protein